MSLTDANVTAIRTARLTDNYWSRRLRVTTGTVRRARIGLSHQHVLTPPDRAPREATGCTHSIRSGLPQVARPARVRRSYYL